MLIQLDDLRRSLDRSEAMEGMDAYTRQAFDILSSRRVFEALDLGREDPRLRAKYGVGDTINEGDGAPCCMDHFLMARRLVEAGVRVVTISFGRWDTHSDNFGSNRRRMPKLDMALAVLSKTCIYGGWTGMSRLSFGASSAALPGSTRRRAEITGSRSALPCWLAEACVPAR